MEVFYVITGGEFNNNLIVSTNNLEFENYCKSEGIDSLLLKREVYKLASKRKYIFIKSLIKLAKNMLI